MDIEKLKDKIKKSGLKLKYIAEMLGISYTALKPKLDGNREFTRSEIQALSIVLNLTSKEKEEIFFN